MRLNVVWREEFHKMLFPGLSMEGGVLLCQLVVVTWALWLVLVNANLLISDSSFSPTKRIRTEATVKMAPRITMSRSPSENLSSIVANCNEESNHDEYTNDANLNTTHMGATAKSSIDGSSENNAVSITSIIFFLYERGK